MPNTRLLVKILETRGNIHLNNNCFRLGYLGFKTVISELSFGEVGSTQQLAPSQVTNRFPVFQLIFLFFTMVRQCRTLSTSIAV